MVPWLGGLFAAVFSSVPASFATDLPLPEAVSRLRANTTRTIFPGFRRQVAVGPVTPERVQLQRVIPFFGNSFKPVFVGAFRHGRDGRVILEGRFTMFPFSKIFISVWLAFAALLTIVVTAAVFHSPDAAAPSEMVGPLIGLAFVAFGIVLVRIGWWLSRGDITYLSDVIRRALTSAPE